MGIELAVAKLAYVVQLRAIAQRWNDHARAFIDVNGSFKHFAYSKASEYLSSAADFYQHGDLRDYRIYLAGSKSWIVSLFRDLSCDNKCDGGVFEGIGERDVLCSCITPSAWDFAQSLLECIPPEPDLNSIKVV